MKRPRQKRSPSPNRKGMCGVRERRICRGRQKIVHVASVSESTAVRGKPTFRTCTFCSCVQQDAAANVTAVNPPPPSATNGYTTLAIGFNKQCESHCPALVRIAILGTATERKTFHILFAGETELQWLPFLRSKRRFRYKASN